MNQSPSIHHRRVCPVCGQGVLLAMKRHPEGQLLLMCDDCESQWNSPTEASAYGNALVIEVRNLVPASEEDLMAAGWTAGAPGV
jgi:formate dehydrogenase maturation protein FdhE